VCSVYSQSVLASIQGNLAPFYQAAKRRSATTGGSKGSGRKSRVEKNGISGRAHFALGENARSPRLGGVHGAKQGCLATRLDRPREGDLRAEKPAPDVKCTPLERNVDSLGAICYPNHRHAIESAQWTQRGERARRENGPLSSTGSTYTDRSKRARAESGLLGAFFVAQYACPRIVKREGIWRAARVRAPGW
jgi:hypothetical protein